MRLMPLILETVRDTRRRAGWPARRTLAALGVSRSAYYRWHGTTPYAEREKRVQPYEILPEERDAVIRYALNHPNIRHRELAYRMMDDDVAYVSPPTVYRILKEAGLVAEWQRAVRERTEIYRGRIPDEKWQTDITYIKLGARNYYLLTFIDEYSRYITYWELLSRMDGDTVSLAAEAALGRLVGERVPIIQSDNGSCFISRDFKIVLRRRGITHHRIRPHTPTDNAIVERVEQTIKDMVHIHEPETPGAAKLVLEGVIRSYNHERLHSGIDFLPPAVMYCGKPEIVLERRRLKQAAARQRRRDKNLQRRQSRLYVEQELRVKREAEPSKNQEPGLSHSR